MKKSKRSYWTAAEAGAVLERIERSGLSVKGFAHKHRLGIERLYRWKRRLAHRSSGQASRPNFTEVTIRPTAPAAVIEIELPVSIGRRISTPSGS